MMAILFNVLVLLMGLGLCGVHWLRQRWSVVRRGRQVRRPGPMS
jgi:hypothetical protein